MKLSIVWIEDLFALYFKCLLKYKDVDEKDMYSTSFSSLLEASERKNSFELFDWIWPCVWCSYCTSSRNRVAIEGGGTFSYLNNFQKRKYLDHSCPMLFLPKKNIALVNPTLTLNYMTSFQSLNPNGTILKSTLVETK